MQDKELKYWNPVTPYITDLLPDDAFGICIKLSGGADSSIIYYRLCKEMVERGINLPIYVATLDTETKPWYSHYAKKVIEFTAERTGIHPVEHNIAYLPNPWTLEDYGREQDEIAFKSFREGKTNVWYGGLTQNETSVFFDHLTLVEDTCGRTVTGRLSIRDPSFYWIHADFSTCDDCGSLSWLGKDIGEICIGNHLADSLLELAQETL